MSDWTGPGLYRFESGQKANCHVSLSGGKRDDGTPVIAWNSDPNKNDVWQISHAGIGWTGKNEYHIINYNSGTFLSYPDKAPEKGIVTGHVLGPANSRVRWNIIPLRDGSGKYSIVAVQGDSMCLNLVSGKTDNATELWLWKGREYPSSHFFLKHYDDKVFYDFPELNKK